MEISILIDYDERNLKVHYEVVDALSDAEEWYIYAIYDELGADLYDYYEEQGCLDEITDAIKEQLQEDAR